MNEISGSEQMRYNNKSVIGFLGENDFFFSEDEMVRTMNYFKLRNFTLLKEYGHLFILERPVRAGKLAFKAIKKATLLE